MLNEVIMELFRTTISLTDLEKCINQMAVSIWVILLTEEHKEEEHLCSQTDLSIKEISQTTVQRLKMECSSPIS